MTPKETILKALNSASDYSGIVASLIEVGVQSYTVDVATGTMLYRLSDENVVLYGKVSPRSISLQFSSRLIKKAIEDSKLGLIDYSTFLDDIAKAGVLFYEVKLNGNNKKATYIGIGDAYEQDFSDF